MLLSFTLVHGDWNLNTTIKTYLRYPTVDITIPMEAFCETVNEGLKSASIKSKYSQIRK